MVVASTRPGEQWRDLISGEGVLLVQVYLFLLSVGPQKADFPIISPFLYSASNAEHGLLFSSL